MPCIIFGPTTLSCKTELLSIYNRNSINDVSYRVYQVETVHCHQPKQVPLKYFGHCFHAGTASH